MSLLTRATFDYTKWQANLWPDVGVDELSLKAMQMRAVQDPKATPE